MTGIGTFAVASAVAAIMVMVSSLRLEYAIPLAGRADAFRLLEISIGLSSLVSLTGVALGAAFGNEILLYSSILSATGSYAAISSYWLIAEGSRRTLAASRALGGIVRLALILLLPAMTSAGAMALVAATSVGQLSSALPGLAAAWQVRGYPRERSVWNTVREYRAFPFFQLPVNVLNSLAAEVLTIGLGIFGTPPAAAAVGMAQRAMARPAQVVVTSLSDTFLADLSAHRSDHAAGAQLATKAIKQLALLATACLALGAPAAYFGLPALLGSNFSSVGNYALPLTFVISARIVANPSAQVLVFFGRHRQHLALTVLRTVMVLTGLGLSYWTTGDPVTATWGFAASSILSYALFVHFARLQLRRSGNAGRQEHTVTERDSIAR